MSFVAELEPRIVWRYFDEILSIPRASKQEEKISKYVIDLAEKHGCSWIQDKVGNIVVQVPASDGLEHAPVVVLQSHLDMVCEKNSDVTHNFDKDPIKPQRDGDFLKATGTTLGADNGIGVAAMLAAMTDDELRHGPLELLFTIDEETGLTGAIQMGDDLLKGRILLNLDTEEEDYLCVGCAGGLNSTLHIPMASGTKPANSQRLRVALTGLKGGHSGAEIHVQKGNAIKLLARILNVLNLQHGIRLAEFRGGDKHNAIPREAFSEIYVSTDKIADARATLEASFAAIQGEYRAVEPDMQLNLEETNQDNTCWDEESSDRLLALMTALPHGVLSMSYDIPDLVETSTNLASVHLKNGQMHVLMSTRSSVNSAIPGVAQRLGAFAKLAGGTFRESDGYPSWQPNMDSELLKVMREIYRKKTGEDPRVGAIHAGLECGLIGAKYEGMDMISFGPLIEYPHSPDEHVKISTVGLFYELLAETLDRLAS